MISTQIGEPFSGTRSRVEGSTFEGGFRDPISDSPVRNFDPTIVFHLMLHTPAEKIERNK